MAPTVTDNCGASAQLVTGRASGSNFSLGSTTVTYRARDSRNLSATCSFTVTVTDNESPVLGNKASDFSLLYLCFISSLSLLLSMSMIFFLWAFLTIVVCPNDTTIYIPAGSCMSSTFAPSPVVATDNCNPLLFRYASYTSLDNRFPPGQFTYGFTLRDNLFTGNQALCSFNLNVVDSTPPTIGSSFLLLIISDTQCAQVHRL